MEKEDEPVESVPEQPVIVMTKKKIPAHEDDGCLARSPKIDHNRLKTRVQLYIDVSEINIY